VSCSPTIAEELRAAKSLSNLAEIKIAITSLPVVAEAEVGAELFWVQFLCHHRE
jgi:hypothetical protein